MGGKEYKKGVRSSERVVEERDRVMCKGDERSSKALEGGREMRVCGIVNRYGKRS